MFACVRVSETVSVCEKERLCLRASARERLFVCVCVCVCEREREREGRTLSAAPAASVHACGPKAGLGYGVRCMGVGSSV